MSFRIALHPVRLNLSFEYHNRGLLDSDIDRLSYSAPDKEFLNKVRAKSKNQEPVIERSIVVTGTSQKPVRYFIRDTYRPVSGGKEVIISDRTFVNNGNGLEQV